MRDYDLKFGDLKSNLRSIFKISRAVLLEVEVFPAFLGAIVVLVQTFSELFSIKIHPALDTVIGGIFYIFDLIARTVIISFLFIIDSVIYAIAYIAGFQFSFELFQISLPGWYTSLTIFSVILSRLLYISDNFVPWQERDHSEEIMSDAERSRFLFGGSRVLAVLHIFIRKVNESFYRKVILFFEVSLAFFLLPVRQDKLGAVIGKQLGYIAAGFLFHGYVKLAGYLLLVANTWSMEIPAAQIRRRFLAIFSTIMALLIVYTWVLIAI